MQVYDKVIKTTEEILAPFHVKDLSKRPAKRWPLLTENEFLLRNEVAFELGRPDGACYLLPGSDIERTLSRRKIIFFWMDWICNRIKKQNVPFTRITWLQIEPERKSR